jgi:hypothetical protein
MELCMANDFTQTEELWYPIDEFPNYEISSTGIIMNSDTNRIMRTSKTLSGVVKVGLMGDDGKQHTRSVKVLVAEAFVGGKDKNRNTPIHLDCDQSNCRADNLAWRPRWFASHYMRQFNKLYSYHTLNEIQDVYTGDIYANIQEAAMVNGLLVKDVLDSCMYQDKVCYPTHQKFSYVSEALRPR